MLSNEEGYGDLREGGVELIPGNTRRQWFFEIYEHSHKANTCLRNLLVLLSGTDVYKRQTMRNGYNYKTDTYTRQTDIHTYLRH